MARTKPEWFSLIQGDLGKIKAFVPLDEAGLEIALSDALDIWGSYVPRVEARQIQIPDGLLVIDLSSEEGEFAVGDFHYTDATVDIHRTLTPFFPIQIIALSLQGPRFQFEINQTIERWSRLLGGKEDQKYDQNTKNLYVWNPRGQEHFTFHIMRPAKVEDIEGHRFMLFRKLFRSRAREQMIQTFTRLGPLPGAHGNIEHDMDRQAELAKQELEEVMPVLERMPEAMVAPRWD